MGAGPARISTIDTAACNFGERTGSADLTVISEAQNNAADIRNREIVLFDVIVYVHSYQFPWLQTAPLVASARFHVFFYCCLQRLLYSHLSDPVALCLRA